MPADDRHVPIEAARTRSGLTVQQLWLRYVALGGSSDAFGVDGYLQGLLHLNSFQQDVLAQAVNEGLEELYRSLLVPLSAPSGDGAVHSSLRAVIDRLLARPSAPHPASAPPGDEGQQPASPPRPPPEQA